jgi:hypothetical protein
MLLHYFQVVGGLSKAGMYDFPLYFGGNLNK